MFFRRVLLVSSLCNSLLSEYISVLEMCKDRDWCWILKEETAASKKGSVSLSSVSFLLIPSISITCLVELTRYVSPAQLLQSIFSRCSLGYFFDQRHTKRSEENWEWYSDSPNSWNILQGNALLFLLSFSCIRCRHQLHSISRVVEECVQ